MIAFNCSTVSDSDGEKREGYKGNKKRFENKFQTFFYVVLPEHTTFSAPFTNIRTGLKIQQSIKIDKQD